MLTRTVAQALIDALSAAALGAWTPVLAFQQGRPTPLQRRLGFAFGWLCLFFAARSASDAFDGRGLGVVVLLIVCVLPLFALMLAEGALRRHAPLALKLLVTLGGGLTGLALLLEGGRPPMSSWGLGSYVILSLLGVTILLLARAGDRCRTRRMRA